jgi:acetone carboxylase, gamma subunit
MKVTITEYLRIDLAAERWECRRCECELGAARENYKQGLLVYDRDPREIHPPLLDPRLYARTYSPDPAWCRILEYYCPNCGTMIEVEYLPPGHPPLHDIDLDIDLLKSRVEAGEFAVAATASTVASPPRGARATHRHSHRGS